MLDTGASMDGGGTYTLQDGTLIGGGEFDGSLVNNGGSVSVSTLHIVGTYSQGVNGELFSSIADPTHYGTINITSLSGSSGGFHSVFGGTASLGGRFDVGTTLPSPPPVGTVVTFITTDRSVTGSFATITKPTGWPTPVDVSDATHFALRFGTVPPPPPTLTSIAVTPAAPTVVAGASTPLAATGTYSDASTADVTSAATWSTSDATTATVDSTGHVTGVHTGIATITATIGSVSGSVVVVVTPAGAIATGSDTGSAPHTNASTVTDEIIISAVSGTGTIIGAVYGSNPVGALASSSGHYWDAWVQPGAFPFVTMQLCPMSPIDQLMWWNPTAGAWQVAQPKSSFSSGSCAGFLFDHTTVPTVDQLTGTVLGAVAKPAAALVLGGTQAIVPGKPFTLNVQIVSGTSACLSAQPVFVTVYDPQFNDVYDDFTTTDSVGAAAITGVDTSSWTTLGAYDVFVDVPAGTCSEAMADELMTVGSAGKSLTGKGTYDAVDFNDGTFQLSASTSKLGVVKGSVSVVVAGAWKIAGKVDHFVTAPDGSGGKLGTVTGLATLSRWNAVANKGKGAWKVVAKNVPFAADFEDAPSFDSLGLNLFYMPPSGAPRLPSSQLRVVHPPGFIKVK